MEKMKFQKITLFSGVMLALNSLIGSGWLFGAGTAAKVAGPAAILSWILGAIIIISIALTYVELGAMFPESGGMSRYAQYSHGPFLGFIAAWANFINHVSPNGSGGLGSIYELVAVGMGKLDPPLYEER